MDFEATGQLIIYFAFIKNMMKKWEHKGSVHQLFIDFKKAYNSVRREVLYNIIKFGIRIKLLRLIKMCPTEKYSRVREDKLSDMFPIRNSLKQGDVLSQLLFNFIVEYAFKGGSGKPGYLEIKYYISDLVYADDVNILGGGIHTIKNTEGLLVGSKEIGLAVNAGKTRYMVWSRD